MYKVIFDYVVGAENRLAGWYVGIGKWTKVFWRHSSFFAVSGTAQTAMTKAELLSYGAL